MKELSVIEDVKYREMKKILYNIYIGFREKSNPCIFRLSEKRNQIIMHIFGKEKLRDLQKAVKNAFPNSEVVIDPSEEKYLDRKADKLAKKEVQIKRMQKVSS